MKCFNTLSDVFQHTANRVWIQYMGIQAIAEILYFSTSTMRVVEYQLTLLYKYCKINTEQLAEIKMALKVFIFTIFFYKNR